jgi:hypothetical protein
MRFHSMTLQTLHSTLFKNRKILSKREAGTVCTYSLYVNVIMGGGDEGTLTRVFY